MILHRDPADGGRVVEAERRGLEGEIGEDRPEKRTEPMGALTDDAGAGLRSGRAEGPPARRGSAGSERSVPGDHARPGPRGMDLLQHIRSARADQRRKRDLTPTLFERVGGLVKESALGEAFLRRLDEFPDEPGETDLKLDGAKPKPPYEPPLFSLSTEGEYRVTMAIIDRLGNRYLEFVNSPDEILLCGPLFRQNPSLPPERLARFHFETLLLAEVARKRLQRLTEQVQGRLDGSGSERRENPQVSFLQARLEEVRSVVARLEEAGCR